MKELPFTPTSPEEFVNLMNLVWDAPCEPAPEGGLIMYQSTLYDDWHDAVKTAEHCGLRRTGGSVRDGQAGHIFRFPNGAGVFIHTDGAGVSAKTSRFGRKRTRH